MFPASQAFPERSDRPQRLAGASLLVFANKQDIHGSMGDLEINEVSQDRIQSSSMNVRLYAGARLGIDKNAPLEDMAV